MTGKSFLDTGCGSLSYSAPELVGCKPYGKEIDIWSMYDSMRLSFIEVMSTVGVSVST